MSVVQRLQVSPGSLPGGIAADSVRDMTSKTVNRLVFAVVGRSIGCLVLAGLVTGCTIMSIPMPPEGPPNVTTVEVSLDPKVNEPLKAPVKASLDLAPVQDFRLTEDKYSLVYLEEARRSYNAKKPVAEIFQDGLSNALRQNGFLGTNRPRYVLRTELQGFGWLPIKVALPAEYQKYGLTTGYDDVPPQFRKPGGSLLDNDHPRRLAVWVIYRLFDPEAKQPFWSLKPQPVWEFNYYGLLRSEEHPYYPDPECGEAFAVTAEDAIRQLITDEKFRAFFELQATNAP